MSVPEVSVIVPVFNGAETIAELYDRLRGMLEGAGEHYEIVIVDDGSRDTTWGLISEFAATNPRVRSLRLSANRGHAAAVAAGMSVAAGDIVAMIDADLETAPECLGELIGAVRAGADLASGKRESVRRWARHLGSWIFNRHAKKLGHSVTDMGCGMNAMTAEVASEFVARGNVGRALVKPFLLAAARNVVEIPVEAQRPKDSRLRAGDLVGLWVRFDVLERPLGLGPFAAVGLCGLLSSVVPLALAALIRPDGPSLILLVGLAVLIALVSLLLVVVSVSMSLTLQLVAEREAPFFRIAADTGTPVHVEPSVNLVALEHPSQWSHPTNGVPPQA